MRILKLLAEFKPKKWQNEGRWIRAKLGMRLARKEVIMNENDATGGLAREQIDYMDKHARCPDCKIGELRIGPRGGAALNVKCNWRFCRHEFNIGIMRGHVVTGERLDRDEPGVYSNAVLQSMESIKKAGGFGGESQ